MIATMIDEGCEKGDLATSVGKALALLDAFDSSSTALGVTELARRAGLPKSTAFRLLAALERARYIERVGSRYSLGRRLFELGNLVSYCRPRHLRDVAAPYLCELYEMSHETVQLGVLDGLDVLYVEKLYGHNHVKTPAHVGVKHPLSASALGKAMLAYSEPDLVSQVVQQLRPLTPYTITSPRVFRRELANVRRDGVAFDREEARLGLTCIAAPIWQWGRVTAAVSISGQPSRFDAPRFADALRRAAALISRNL